MFDILYKLIFFLFELKCNDLVKKFVFVEKLLWVIVFNIKIKIIVLVNWLYVICEK